MTLPASGPLSLAQIAGEFGGAVPHALSEYYGAAAGIPASGAISIGQFYGKASTFTLTIASNVANPNIPSLASAAGWNGSARLVVNITAALINTIDLLSSWSFPGGLEINISAATRVGGYRKAEGVRGGTAFKTAIPVVVNNLGTLSGCGGAGGSGGRSYADYKTTADRVWGWQGNGGLAQGFATASALVVSAATAGTAGTKETFSGPVFGGETQPWAQGGNGGAGGAWGANGTNGSMGMVGGTIYGYSSGAVVGGAGAPGGYAIEGNALITWINTGTRVGAVV